MVNRNGLLGTSALGALGVILVAHSVSGFATAQEDSLFIRDRNISVLERNRPEYNAPGILAGQFIVKPRLDVGVGWTSNAFSLSDVPASLGFDKYEEESDTYVFARPSVHGETIWSRHAIGFGAYAELFQNNRFSSETITNVGANIEGQLDLTREAALFGGASYEKLHESRRYNTTAFLFEEPVSYTKSKAYAGFQHEMGRIRYKGRIDLATYDFDDVELVPEALVIPNADPDQDFRDRTNYSVLGQVAFAVTRDTAIFFQGKYNTFDYDQPVTAGGYDRDSEGWEVAVGSEFDLTRLIRGSVALGYFEQDYDDQRFGTADGLSIDGRLEWFPTELTTVTLSARRGIDESAVINAGGYVTTEARVRVDHELRRNLTLYAYGVTGEVEYPNAFRFGGADAPLREQNIDRFGAGLGATYFVSPYASVSLGYAYRDQDVAVSAFEGGFDKDYESHDLLLTLTLKR